MGYWKYYDNQPLALYRHLCEHAFEQLAVRQKTIDTLTTRAAWLERQADVRQRLQEAVGVFPTKAPLNPVITGRVEKDGIVVEKLFYESIPNYYVTAALFLPKARKGKLPAIVFCSGHSANGFRSKGYQHMMLNYVKKGFAVLAFDPIGQGERIQYSDSVRAGGQTRSPFKPTHEHSYPGAQLFAAGIPPANFFIWDGIRAVDYLLTRAEIDADRIGIAGRSGGGTQSAYIAAFDPRIRAAAPECYLTSFDKLLRSVGPQDAEQNLMGMIAKGLDLTDLLVARAPKPTLMVTTTRDMFSIDGAREMFTEAKEAFRMLGNADNVAKVEDDAGHASTIKNREATYAFFQQHLNNPGSPKDMEVNCFDDDELTVTPTGNVYTSMQGKTMFSLAQDQLTTMTELAAKYPRGEEDALALTDKVVELSGYTAPAMGEVVFSGRSHREEIMVEKYMVQGPGKYMLPVLVFRALLSNGKALLVVDPEGKAEAGKAGGIAEQFVKAGYDVVMPDLSGVGELSDGYLRGGDSFVNGTSLNLWFMGILTQKSLVAIRMEEIQLIIWFMHRELGATEIAAVGSGALAADLLHAALLIPSIQDLVLVEGLVSYRSILEHVDYEPRFIPSVVPGALPVYDLPALAAMSSANVLLVNPVDARGRPVTGEAVGQLYAQAEAGITDVNERVLAWLRQ